MAWTTGAGAWHWQEAFDWYSTVNENRPGRIPSYSLVDAQVSYRR